MISTAAVTIRVSPIVGQASEQRILLGQDVAALAHAVVDDPAMLLVALVVIGAGDRDVLIGIDLVRTRGRDVVVDVGIALDHGIGLLPAGAEIRRSLVFGPRWTRIVARRIGEVRATGQRPREDEREQCLRHNDQRESGTDMVNLVPLAPVCNRNLRAAAARQSNRPNLTRSWPVMSTKTTRMVSSPPSEQNFSTRGLSGRLRPASMARKTRWPPSSTGIGSRLTMPILTDSSAISRTRAPKPSSMKVWPLTSAIRIGPPSSSKLRSPVMISPMATTLLATNCPVSRALSTMAAAGP